MKAYIVKPLTWTRMQPRGEFACLEYQAESSLGDLIVRRIYRGWEFVPPPGWKCNSTLKTKKAAIALAEQFYGERMSMGLVEVQGSHS